MNVAIYTRVSTDDQAQRQTRHEITPASVGQRLEAMLALGSQPSREMLRRAIGAIEIREGMAPLVKPAAIPGLPQTGCRLLRFRMVA